MTIAKLFSTFPVKEGELVTVAPFNETDCSKCGAHLISPQDDMKSLDCVHVLCINCYHAELAKDKTNIVNGEVI